MLRLITSILNILYNGVTCFAHILSNRIHNNTPPFYKLRRVHMVPAFIFLY